VTGAALPAVLGGEPAFSDRLPLVRPTLSDVPGLTAELGAILDSGLLTNAGTVRRLEEVVAERLGTHVVAVASCTAGLMLTYQALGVAGGRVVLPSFTFSASGHAVLWAGGTVDFADVEPERATLDPACLAGLLDGAAAVSATHVYGSPCEVEALQALADAAGVPIVYDAAHALGSSRAGVPIGGFGAAEVFSLSPTKVVVAGEGGLVATRDGALAETLRMGRDYGNPGDYDTRFAGLNARMSELHAAVALASFARLDDHVAARGGLVDRFEKAVSGVPGLRVVRPAEGDVSTFKDLTVVIDANAFGLDAPSLQRALSAEGIDSRRYYHPPIHRQAAYAEQWPSPRALPVTDHLAGSVLSPPLWSHLEPEAMDRVAGAIMVVQEHATDVVRALGDER
jgi:dTDP-4-amino-4,6-dideoxygalactose transaminase